MQGSCEHFLAPKICLTYNIQNLLNNLVNIIIHSEILILQFFLSNFNDRLLLPSFFLLFANKTIIRVGAYCCLATSAVVGLGDAGITFLPGDSPNAIWRSLNYWFHLSPKVGWKWSNGVGKGEMSIIWCISITNNVKSCKKFNETAQRLTSLISH